MNLPYSLDDLPAWQQPLLNAVEGSLARQFGERLQSLQQSWQTGRIDHEAFKDLANGIIADLKEHENDLSYWQHHLANADVGLQYQRAETQGRALDHHSVDAERLLQYVSPAAQPHARQGHSMNALSVVEDAMRRGVGTDQAVTEGLATHTFRNRVEIENLRLYAGQFSRHGLGAGS